MERLDESDNEEKEGMDKYEDEKRLNDDKNGITIIIHKDKGIFLKVKYMQKMTIMLRQTVMFSGTYGVLENITGAGE